MNEFPKKKLQMTFLQTAKGRVFLALGLIFVVIIVIGFIAHWRSQIALNAAGASVSGTPGIASTPGAGNPSDAYVAAQTSANIQGEIDARKKATAFVPTITRSGFVGNPDDFGKDTTPEAKPNCGTNKVVVMFKPNPEACSDKNLQLARQSGVTAEELICQGCACPALKSAGYNAGDLKKIGLTATQLRACGFTLQELVSAGFDAADLKGAGFSPSELKAAGFTAGELKDAGFSAADLKAAGFSNADAASVSCSVAKLTQERAAGVSASKLKSEGCGATALKAAGFTAAELKSAGFSDDDLAAAGFTPSQIAAAKAAIAAMCNPTKLAQERAAGVSAETLKNEGCGAAALKAAGFTAAQLKAAGFSADELKEGGFSNAELAAAGFTPAEIQKADADSKACNLEKLKQERVDGVSATALRQQGCGLAALKAAGFSAAALRAAGFSAAQLKDAGFSAKQLRDAGFSAAELKAAGFSAAALKDAGFSAADLKAAGYSAGQLAAAGFSAKELRDAGFSAAQLHRTGMTVAELKGGGFGLNALKVAGFTKGDLLRAGFSPADAGYATEKEASAVTAAPEDNLATATLPPGSELPGIGSDSRQARLAQFEKQEQAEMTQQQRANQIQTMEAYMTSMANTLMTGWSAVTNQQLQKAPEEKKKTEGGADANGSNTLAGAAGSTGVGAAPTGPTIKAGSVLFAVIDTSINSDEDTPIMARIVTGMLNGSKLLGTFSRRHKNLLISFTTLSNPHFTKSIAINAVAIDPDTARTAVSGDVNSHYLLRYGSLFASSFVQGVSQAIVNQGTTSSCLVGNFGCTLQQTPLSVNKEIAVGVGAVGQAYATHMGQSFNRAPTIRIGAGTGIGLLFMSDLTLPSNPDSKVMAHGETVLGGEQQ